MASLVIGRRRIRMRFFVFLILLVSPVVYLYWTTRPADTYTAINYGQVLLNDSGPAVIIRSEAIYTAPAYGKAVHIAANGTTVAKDQPVAVLYKENYDESVMDELYIIQEKIIQYQQDKLIDQIIGTDIDRLNNDLDTLVSEIRTLIRGRNMHPMLQRESQMRRLLEQKQRLLDIQAEPDEYLTRLYQDEADIRKRIEDWTIDIVAPEPGLVSFSVDGYENILGVDSVDKLTADDFRQIISRSGDSPRQTATVAAEAEQPFFRIVDPHSKWYAVMETSSNADYYNRGDEIEVSFGEDTRSASIYRIIREDGISLIILEFEGNIGDVIDRRVLPVHINKEVQGLIVPHSAIVRNKGRTGVYIKDREENIFIETSVKAVSEGFAVVESISDNQVLQLHDQVKIHK